MGGVQRHKEVSTDRHPLGNMWGTGASRFRRFVTRRDAGEASARVRRLPRHRVGVGFPDGLKLLHLYAEFSAAPNFYTFTLLAHFLHRALRARVCPILASFIATLHH